MKKKTRASRLSTYNAASRLFISHTRTEHSFTTSSTIKPCITAGQGPSSVVVLFPFLLVVLDLLELEIGRACILDTPALEEVDFGWRMKAAQYFLQNIHLVVEADWALSPVRDRKTFVGVEVRDVSKPVVLLIQNRIQRCCSMVVKPSAQDHEVLVLWRVHGEVR
jgi:hypothetical protein